MNRFSTLSKEECETLIDALMFDRLDEYGLATKLMHEVMKVFDERSEEVVKV